MRDRNYKSVCFGCTRRAAGCRATCEEYKAERKARMDEYDRRTERSKVTSASIELRKGRQKR